MSIGFLQQKKKNSFKTENDILDTNGSEIDFDNTVDQYNVIVFDNTIPSMADQTQRIGTLDVYFYDHPEWNVSISDVTAKGQGTSSMKYWIWNTRYQLDKNLSVITHADGSTSKKYGRWYLGFRQDRNLQQKRILPLPCNLIKSAQSILTLIYINK
ncbi:hypothetical protein [Bacteroides thetaiotaomicron]|uniref:hypothetical protein n=1 Tax=Bacteroides thetaiotaomicron TaxID=818 RepID=UPI0039C8AAF3